MRKGWASPRRRVATSTGPPKRSLDRGAPGEILRLQLAKYGSIGRTAQIRSRRGIQATIYKTLLDMGENEC